MKEIKTCVFILLWVSIYGCQHPQQDRLSIIKGGYLSSGKEEFAFNELPEHKRKQGYANFCRYTKSFACKNTLSYKEHLGMKGYFITDSHVTIDPFGYYTYRVILENGNKYYFVSKAPYGDSSKKYSQIVSLNIYKKIKLFKKAPLVPNSNIVVNSIKIKYETLYVSLSNGDIIQEEKLNVIREICKKYNNPKIAKLLLKMRIEKDEMDYRFKIEPLSSKGVVYRSPVELHLRIDDSSQRLLFIITYRGQDWLFVNSYKIAADDLRWKSPRLSFKRDHAGGKVWEWLTIPVNDTYLNIAKKLANANKATIRFIGDSYYSDEQLSSDQKRGIKSIIKLFDLMNSK